MMIWQREMTGIEISGMVCLTISLELVGVHDDSGPLDDILGHSNTPPTRGAMAAVTNAVTYGGIFLSLYIYTLTV